MHLNNRYLCILFLNFKFVYLYTALIKIKNTKHIISTCNTNKKKYIYNIVYYINKQEYKVCVTMYSIMIRIYIGYKCQNILNNQ